MASVIERNSGENKVQDVLAGTVLPEENLQAILSQIETSLCSKYLELHLPDTNWLGNKQLKLADIDITMKMHVRNRFGAEEDVGSIQISDIFKEVNGKIPRRMLVVAPTGYGKTTLAMKIAYDWATNKQYISSIYKAVLIISLRNVHNDLDEFIVQETRIEGYSSIEILQAISYFQENVLLILDGFDEMPEVSKRDIMLLLKRDKYPHMSVIVTTLPGIFHVEVEKSSPQCHRRRRFISMRSAAAEKLPFWTKRIEILGVLQENQSAFLGKYFGNRGKVLQQKMSAELQADIVFLCECPLMYLLLAVVYDDQGFPSPLTKTQLFRVIVNFLLRKNFIDEKSISPEKNIDMFQLPRENLLYQFGDLALRNLKIGKYFFPETEILEQCEKDKKFLEVGFLFRCLKFPMNSKTEYNQVVHPVFLDFFAALHLASFDSTHPDAHEGLKTDVSTLIEKGFIRDKDCFVFPFLVGLLGTKAHILFKIISSWGALYRVDAYPLANMLTEITLSGDITASLAPLIPPKWEIDTWNIDTSSSFFLSVAHGTLVAYGTRSNHIRILEWNPIYECNFPDILNVERLEIRIADEFHPSFNNILKKKISCKDLVCHFVNFQDKNWEKVVSFLSLVQSERVTIGAWSVVNENFPLKFCTEMAEGRLKNVNLHRLGLFGLNPHKDRKVLTLLEGLLQKQRIKEGIWLEVWKDSNLWNSFCGLFNARIRPEDLKSFFNQVTKSTLEEMVCIAMSLQNTTLDIDQFCNEGKRPWKFLYTDGDIQIKFEKHKHHGYLPIEEMKICWWKDSNMTTTMDVLYLCQNIKRIACRNEVIKEVTKAIPQDWPGYQTTEEINLKLFKDTIHPDQIDGLLSFKNLQVLSLDVGSLGSASLPASIASSLIFIIPSLPLRILEVVRIKEVNVPFLERILGGIVYSDQKKETQILWEKYDPFRMGEGSREIFRRNTDKERIQIERIEMGFHPEVTVNELKYCFSFLFQLLSNKQVEKFSIVDINVNLEENITSHFFAFKDSFRIQREVQGFDQNDSMRSQRKLNYVGLIRDKLSITRKK